MITIIIVNVIIILCTKNTSKHKYKFTDQDYADDAVLFSDCPSKWPYILSSFDEAARTMGINTSWSKTKIQNLGHGVTPAPVQLQIAPRVWNSLPPAIRDPSLSPSIFGKLLKTYLFV